MKTTKKLTISGVVVALYVIVMMLTQGFAFGQFQIRIATGLYALAYQFPFLIIPMGIANLLSNTLMGGLGLLDMIGGCLVGIITTILVVKLKEVNAPKWVVVLPITLIPTTLVPIWLSYILHIPYIALFLSLLVGQTISAYTLGLFIVSRKWDR